MQVVGCPRCGHENRAAMSVTLCYRCGCDISTLARTGDPEAETRFALRPDEYATDEFVPEPERTPEPAPSAPAMPAASIPLDVVARLILAVSAVALGLGVGLTVGAGSAMGADPEISGSVAILAVAAALSGLVMVLIGGGSERTQRMTVGLRAVGFLLAAGGIWAATTIALEPVRQGLRGEAPAETQAPVPYGSRMMPPSASYPPGPGMMGPGGGPGMSGPDGRPGYVMPPPPSSGGPAPMPERPPGDRR